MEILICGNMWYYYRHRQNIMLIIHMLGECKMKQHISETDLLELTENEKQNLRNLWIPKERDLAVAFICSNAETDEYDLIIFTVGRVDFDKFDTEGVIYSSRNKHYNITLRSLKLVDDDFADETEKDDDIIEDLELDYQAPDDYFSYEYCLPLFNIGQMIEILSKNKFTNTDFCICYNKEEGRYQVDEVIDIYRNQYINHEPNELCDVLWESVKTLL